MARRIKIKGRLRYILIGIVLVLFFGNILFPSMLSEVIGSAGRGFSLFRAGNVEQYKRNLIGHWLGTAKGAYETGFIIALADERLVVRYWAEVDEGTIRLSLNRYNFTNFFETAWSDSVRRSGDGSFVIDVPSTGVYNLRLSYFSFAGAIELDWAVE